jgi:hypothetical protein
MEELAKNETSRKQVASKLFDSEDGGDTFLRNID